MAPPHVARCIRLNSRHSYRRLIAAVAVVASALVLGAVHTQPAAAATAPTAAAMTAAVYARINSERLGNGVHSLRAKASLIGTAHLHNLNMARANTMSHQLAGEPSFGARVSRYGYRWCAAAENIGWSSDISVNGAAVIDFWMYHEVAPNDPHRRNLLNPRYTDVGVDVYIDLAHRKIWLTEEFGTPA